MRNKLVLFIFAAAVAPLVLASVPAFGKTATVGAPLPLTGKFMEFGAMMKNSMEMAADYVNQTGGIDGDRLEIVFADDKGEEGAVESAFYKLMDEKPAMLVGGYASNPTFRLAKIAEKNDIPFLICTASADRITQQGWDNIFRMNPPVSEYTQGLEDFWIKNAKPRSMAIVYENSMFGTDAALGMIEFCREHAIAVTAPIGYDRTQESAIYYRSMLAPLAGDVPDAIYMVSYLEDAVMLVKTIRELKLPSLLCGGAGGFTTDEFAKRAGKNANLMLTAALWSEHAGYPGAEEYFNQYRNRFGKSPDYHGAEAYSAILVAADALKRAKSAKPADIRKSLGETYLKTPFGPVKFYNYEDYKRQNSVSTLVLQIVDGKFETVWPPHVASRPYVAPTK